MHVMSGIKIVLLLIVVQILGFNTESTGHCNSLYPLSNPVPTQEGVKFPIGVVSDFHDKSTGVWTSHLKRGHLIWNSNAILVDVIWDEDQDLVLNVNPDAGEEDRQVSELLTYDGKLLILNRRGVMLEIIGQQLLPWKTVKNEDGALSNSFTADWATVKDGKVLVGGLDLEGAPFKAAASLQWTRILEENGKEGKFSWKAKYPPLAYAVGHETHGYMKFGAVTWSCTTKRWYIMPSECSKNDYDTNPSINVGCNILLTANENFTDIEVAEVGKNEPTREFTSFKFVPSTSDTIIVALKSSRNVMKPESYITVFSPVGQILLPTTKVDDKIYKAIEFL